MVTLSMYNANSFTQSAMLDGEPYKLIYNWNDRAGQWTIDILQNDNTEIIRGVTIVPNLPLLSFHRRIDDMPPGELMAVVVNQDEDENQTIGRQDFLNGKFTMVYIPRNEVNEILEASIQN